MKTQWQAGFVEGLAFKETNAEVTKPTVPTNQKTTIAVNSPANATPKSYEDLLKENEQLLHERNTLGQAVRDAAVSAGIIRADVSLTLPHLLTLCTDLATGASQQPLSVDEQKGVLEDPDGVRVLMNYHLGKLCEFDSIAQAGDGRCGSEARLAELKAIGREIIEADLGIWGDELLQHFGFAEELARRSSQQPRP